MNESARPAFLLAYALVAGACTRAPQVAAAGPDAGTIVVATQTARTAGAVLFTGEGPLRAHLAGDDTPLPPESSRCRNCHVGAASSGAPSAAGDPGTASFGPALTPALLIEARARRGGPPSRYTRDSFCTLLRTGVDPAYVLLPRVMPRYELTHAECAALWSFLTGSGA